MRIGVVGSMGYAEDLLDARDILRDSYGHDAYTTKFAQQFLGKTPREKELLKLHQKFNEDAILEFWNLMQGGDAILVINRTAHDIDNYVGGNAFLEIGFAHVLGQKIFLLNPIPRIPLYETEIAAMKPVVIYGDFGLIK